MTNEEKNISEYKVLRLMTKEIIICKVNNSGPEATNWWTLEDPFEIKSFMNPNTGDFNSTLIDWLQFASSTETKISLNDILTVSDPDGEVLDHYVSIVKRKRGIVEYQVKEGKEALELVEKLKSTGSNEPEVTFEDYMEILNTNKVYH